MKEIKLYQWDDSLIWCPSQCYYYFKDRNDNLKCIYLRWRHSDPWTAEIIPINEDGSFNHVQRENLNPPFFKDEELDLLKEWCLNKLSIRNKHK